MERFPSRLREIRREKGLTIEELAGATGVAARTIKLLEGEEGSNPQLSTLKRLVRYLEVSIEDIFPA